MFFNVVKEYIYFNCISERGDLIQFYNKVYVQCMQSFALRFTGRHKDVSRFVLLFVCLDVWNHNILLLHFLVCNKGNVYFALTNQV